MPDRRRFTPSVDALESRLPLDGSAWDGGPGDASGDVYDLPDPWTDPGSGAYYGPQMTCTPDPTEPGNFTLPCSYWDPTTGDQMYIERYGCGDLP